MFPSPIFAALSSDGGEFRAFCLVIMFSKHNSLNLASGNFAGTAVEPSISGVFWQMV
jgi:hypothetical protein